MNNKFQLFHQVFTWLLKWYLPSIQGGPEMIKHMIDLWQAYISNHGLKWTISRMKLIRLIVTRYISGTPYFPDEKIGMRKDGLPKAIGPLLPLFQTPTPEKLRFGLSLLAIGRALTLPLEPNYTAIEAPPKETTGLSAVISFIQSNCHRVKWSLKA